MRRSAPRTTFASAIAALAGALLLAGCGDIPAPTADPVGPPPRLPGTPSYDASLEPAAAVLPWVPADATTLSVTDWDEVRTQLGVPDLTSRDTAADRSEFWSRAASEAPLLSAGMLRADGSTLELDYGFTQDDVDWEAHFRGEGGSGWVLAFRPDVDMGAVGRAVHDGAGPLAGATVRPQDHLVLSGQESDPTHSWATDATVVPLVGRPAEASLVRRGCLPVAEALGPGAAARQRDRVLAHADVTDLDTLYAFALEFGDHVATVRMPRHRMDLFDRLHLGDAWPTTGHASFADGFTRGVGDPATGRIGYDVPNPPVAARVALGGTLPFGVCNSVG